MNSCTAESGYWHDHLNYILAMNTSLLLYEEPSGTTIVLDIKYVISPLNSSLVVLMIYVYFTVYTFKLATSIFKNQCRQYDSKKIVNWQALTMKYECFTCMLTYIATMILKSWDTSIDFCLWHFSATHECRSQPTFQYFNVYRVTLR